MLELYQNLDLDIDDIAEHYREMAAIIFEVGS